MAGRRDNDGCLGIGLVGCGRAGVLLHLPALSRVRGVRVTALADTEPARLAEAARLAPTAATYGDYRRLLEDPRVDLAAVCVPPAAHAPVAVAAIGAGKHVMVEKPLAHSLDAADAIVAAARASRATVGVGHQLRCHRLVQRARAELAGGGLGHVTAARTAWTTDLRHPAGSWQRQPGQAGSVICEIGLHHLDLVRYLLGARAVEVSARMREEEAGSGRAVVSANLEAGVVMTALFARGTAATNELSFYGERGALRLDCYRFDGLTRLGAADGLAGRLRRPLASTVEALGAAARLRRGGDFLDSYRRHWEAFLGAVRGEGPVPCPPEEARDALAAALAAEASTVSGRPVRVDEAAYGAALAGRA
ncbi:MAG TPA: Gfo/Idh/MocA family oxidoreductase [Vicinamibacteria bacterium]|nr:Gfo/Idh/MocA family oxidoreductase [Vicinamibacteria bacterium]